MTARIAFLGDTLLGGSAQDIIDAEGYGFPLVSIKHLWADTDLVIANHEASLTTRDEPAAKADTGKKRYWYKGKPESAHALYEHGVRVVSLANNHVGDFGGDGVLDTMAALDSAHIAHCGAGASDAAARRPVTVRANGLQVGFLSIMQRYQMYVDEGFTRGWETQDPRCCGPVGFRQTSRSSAKAWTCAWCSSTGVATTSR